MSLHSKSHGQSKQDDIFGSKSHILECLMLHSRRPRFAWPYSIETAQLPYTDLLYLSVPKQSLRQQDLLGPPAKALPVLSMIIMCTMNQRTAVRPCISHSRRIGTVAKLTHHRLCPLQAFHKRTPRVACCIGKGFLPECLVVIACAAHVHVVKHVRV